jgi:2-polyprenyl-3-methyl-5-hydroxy-6-metoxy-1,4-benzoquinol methylase
MKCRICDASARHFSTRKVLGKYDVAYFQCPDCRFIQTEEPYWLAEAYGSAIAQLDVGVVSRSEHLLRVVPTLLKMYFKPEARFLDFGGGYGLFVRMMRDRGFDFYRQDRYCENVFARHFDLADLPPRSRFDLLTAFEVVEHLPDPVAELSAMLQLSDNVLFFTELQPEDPAALEQWWYFSPETGQHVSLFHRRSLAALARRTGLHLLSHENLHLLSRTPRSALIYRMAFRRSFRRAVGFLYKRKSLLLRDVEHVRTRTG